MKCLKKKKKEKKVTWNFKSPWVSQMNREPEAESGYSLQALVLVHEALKEGLLGAPLDLHRRLVSHALLITTENQEVT